MAESPKNDDESIRSYILNDVLEKVPLYKSYENLCKVIGNDAIAFYDFQFWYYRFLSGKQDLDFDRSSEPEPLQFSDLPVDAVGLIVDKLKMVERLMLRRVSKPLRDFVERQEIDNTYIDISCGDDLISIRYQNARIAYAKNCEVLSLYTHAFRLQESSFVYGDHFESEAFNDLAWIIKKPKLRLGSLNFSQVAPWPPRADRADNGAVVALKLFNKIVFLLKSLKHQIAVQELSLQPKQPDDILAILPYLKPGYLKKITISGRKTCGDWKNVENSRKVERFMQLDQWKQAEELVLYGALGLFPDEVLLQFKKYWIKTYTLHKYDLAATRILFAASPVFEYCYFDIKEPSYDDDYMNFLGVPGPLTENYRSVRHYMIPNTDKLLVFKEFTYRDIEVEKKTRDAQ